MNNVFHEGEYYIQELMGIRQSSDTLSYIIRDTLPKIAKEFLINLKFCVITLSTQNKNLFSSVIYDSSSFIKIQDDNTICISLKNRSYLPQSYFDEKDLQIGFLGLDFENARRIRINGSANIINDTLKVNIQEVYSNCPKYIKKRIYKKVLKPKMTQCITYNKILNEELIEIISRSDTFFLSSSHKDKGADISHKGGKKGFVKIISSNKLQFVDMPGNNLYNTLGNIYTNSYVNVLFIDFENNDTYLIFGKAIFNKILVDDKSILMVTIECFDIIKNTNCFLLDYDYN